MLEKSNDDIPADELALAARIARIEATNQAFAAMSPARKRVAIAKDVLLWCDLGRFIPQNGTYLWTHSPRNANDWVDTEVVNGYSCTVCALGSVFAACADRVGGFGDRLMSFSSDSMHRQLSPYFSAEQLAKMEMAFEGFHLVEAAGPDGNTAVIDRAATDYCDDIERFDHGGNTIPAAAYGRLVRIMKNIVRNRGTFNPRDLTGLPANHPVRHIVAQEAKAA